MKYKLHPAALRELDDAVQWYESRRESLGLSLILRVNVAIEQIRQNPERFPRVTSRHRRAKVPGFPYGIVYRVEDNIIRVMSIMHLTRKPQYWKGRDR